MTSPLQHAIATIQAGDYSTGHQLLKHVVSNEPRSEQAWFWMSSVIDSVDHRRQCMEQVLAINPGNKLAQRALHMLLTNWSSSLMIQEDEVRTQQQRLATDKATLDYDTTKWQTDQQTLIEFQTTLCIYQDQITAHVQRLQAVLYAVTGQQVAIHTDAHHLGLATTSLQQTLDTIEQLQVAFDHHTHELCERENRVRNQYNTLQAWQQRLTEQETALATEQPSVEWHQKVAAPQHVVLDPPILANGRYQLSPSLKRLFDDLIKAPYNQSRNSPSWQHADVENRRQDIIGKGQADFRKAIEGLPPKDIVLLYCYANMRMHFFSSYHIFDKHREVLDTDILAGQQRVLFVDIGCGPLTSGLAFNAFTKGLVNRPHLTYIGVDHAPAMLEKAADFNQYDGCYFDIFDTCDNYQKLPGVLREYISNQEELVIIFNMCYFFASPTLDITEFSAMMCDLTETYKHCRICFIYQDPNNYSIPAQRWNTFLQSFGHFTRLVDKPVETIQYTLAEDKSVSVKYDILTNQPHDATRTNSDTATHTIRYQSARPNVRTRVCARPQR